MQINISILGFHSATPRPNAHNSAQVVEMSNRYFLVDCGEGTQMQMRKFGISFSKINHIFISHLHGDHFFGLVGLISTLAMLGREKELHIYAPEGLKKIVGMQLETTEARLKFPIKFHVLKSDQPLVIYEDERVVVSTLPLWHRVYTNGFLFRHKPGDRKLNIEAVRKYPEIEKCDYRKIKKGHDYILQDGTRIPNSELTEPPLPVKSYAYCSDTRYHTPLIRWIEDVDLLYHESTFLSDREDLAHKTGHSTAAQAASIAVQAGAGRLILGHFSSRYKDICAFLEEAQPVFPHVELAREGKNVFSV